MTKQRFISGTLILTVAAIFACGASPKPPTHRLTQAKAATRAAEEVEAQKEPQAALYLKMANDHIVEAERLIGKEEMGKARNLLMRAEADAELSIALAKAAEEQARAEEAMAKLRQLQKRAEWARRWIHCTWIRGRYR